MIADCLIDISDVLSSVDAESAWADLQTDNDDQPIKQSMLQLVKTSLCCLNVKRGLNWECIESYKLTIFLSSKTNSADGHSNEEK